ncbi:MAG: small nuclear ribonucleoprotein [Nanoarchaeota archaeon]|nr:small nuclear ribonucleoprotein [Nanoarchaeota archaeon]
MEITKPLDALNMAKNTKVLAELKNGSQFVGTLRAFDIHLNIVFDDAQEIIDGEIKRNLGRILLRGDTVLLLSPQKK